MLTADKGVIGCYIVKNVEFVRIARKELDDLSGEGAGSLQDEKSLSNSRITQSLSASRSWIRAVFPLTPVTRVSH